jgi:hypothetical protein
MRQARPSHVWDKVVINLQGPGQAPTSAEGSHGHLADVVASQLQRALGPNPGLGILRERREAVHLLEDPREELGGLDGVEAAEVLVVLVKASDDQLHRVVGGVKWPHRVAV